MNTFTLKFIVLLKKNYTKTEISTDTVVSRQMCIYSKSRARPLYQCSRKKFTDSLYSRGLERRQGLRQGKASGLRKGTGRPGHEGVERHNA